MLGDETNADGMARWGPLGVAALAYVAVGAWDWTDTVEALARFVILTRLKPRAALLCITAGVAVLLEQVRFSGSVMSLGCTL